MADEDFAAQVDRMFRADFEGSRLMEPGELERKPWWFRLAVRVARLSAPIL
jgi:cardiolipin synthase